MEEYVYRAAEFYNGIDNAEDWINEQAKDGFRLHTFTQSEDDKAIHYSVVMEGKNP